MGDLRVRRPADKEGLINQLAGDSDDALFGSMRDLFVFAAALGKSENKSVPLSGSSGDPIRLELFQKDSGHELLIHSLAVLSHPEDPEILREDREADRVVLFEEFVNGGLEIIQAHLNAHRLVRLDDAIQMLVAHQIDKRRSEGGVDLSRFADELGL